MTTKIYPLNSLQYYRYVVTLSIYQEKLLLSRHKLRDTWETQGGHVEAGETPLEAAKRELYEESGAVEYDIFPLCDYWAGEENDGNGGNGMVFYAVIRRLGALPDNEMQEIRQFDALPENLTYPQITPVLYAYLKRQSDVKECGHADA